MSYKSLLHELFINVLQNLSRGGDFQKDPTGIVTGTRLGL